MAAIGTAAAQDLINQGVEKGYTAKEVIAYVKKVDGRDPQYISKAAARRISGAISEWASRATVEAIATTTVTESDEPRATARQVDFIARLYAEFATPAGVAQRQRWATLSRREASHLIDDYKRTAGWS